MGGTLTRVITHPSQAGYGVNLLEKSAPLVVAQAGTAVVGIVGHFPWGPVDTIIEVGSVAEALIAVAPAAFNESKDTTAFPALSALPLPWPSGIRLVRVSAGGAAKSTLSIDGGAITVTAKYVGAAGDSISVEVTAATGGDGAERDVIIRVGSAYKATYKDMSVGEFPAIVDPYVDITETGLPAITAETPLAGGNDGAVAAGNYVPGIGNEAGLELFESDASDVSVAFCAGVTSGLVDAVNAGIKTFLATTGKPLFVVYSTPVGTSAADIRGKVTSLRTDRGTLCWPRVFVQDTYQNTLPTITVDGNSEAACAIASVPPERSPGGVQGVPFLTRILGLETQSPSRATMDDILADGIAAFFVSRKLGTILKGGVTTSTDPRLKDIYRRRMTDFITWSLADALESYAEMPIDFEISGGKVVLGSVTGAEVGVVTNFLQSLVDDKRLTAYSIDYQSGNTLATKAAGVFNIGIAVQLYGSQMAIILTHTIGSGVQV